MKSFFITALMLGFFALNGCSQQSNANNDSSMQTTVRVGGTCEGCEAVFESPLPFEQLSWIDTLPDFSEPGPKLMIEGIILKADGITPAPDVVLYIYHTDQAGNYPTKGDEKGWAKRHGYIRGWVKTNQKGQYRFYTLKPASYPNTTVLKHIHPVIKEPGINAYWIDEFLFDDDPFLSARDRKNQRQYGGIGIMKLTKKGDLLIGKRNIYLGKNIPGYPGK